MTQQEREEQRLHKEYTELFYEKGLVEGVKILMSTHESRIRESIAESIEKAHNYPCRCRQKNIACLHNFNSMKISASIARGVKEE